MSSTTLAFDILARDRGASRTFTGIGRSASSSSRGVRLLGSAMKYTALGIAGGVTAAAALGAKLAKSAAEDQVSARALALQQRNSADATRGQIRATEDWITVQGKALGVTDDELRPALGKLVAATHDVTKARRLASLAEDVAAGRGKSLSTVTEALAKAQLGSLGGLARLGVRTKDAAGNTLTLKQVTQDLANTYRGQAAKAADTASGRYNRLRVMLSETGEAIGYKLLPPATELAGWILDKGVPLAERFASSLEDELGSSIQSLGQWVKTDGVDTLHDLGDVLTGDVLPALKTTGRVVGDAVGFFNDLPEPVRHIGIEAGIAALVMPRLTTGISAVTDSVKSNVTALRTWRAELGQTEASGNRVATMTSKLGSAAKTAAGVGGMVALAEGTKEADRGLKTLELTAGGALMGFSVGGPWGAAIGGGAGALIGLASSTEKVIQPLRTMHKAAEDSVGAQLDLRDALDQTTGAMTRQARQTVSQDIYNQHLGQSARTLGIDTRDLVSAILGQEGAYKRVMKAVREYQNVGGANASNRQNALSDAAVNIGAYLEGAAAKFRHTRDEIRAVNAGTVTWSKVLHGLPKDVRVAIRQLGAAPAIRDVRALGRQYGLTPRRVEVLIRQLGAQKVQGEARQTRHDVESIGAAKVNLTPALRAVTQFSLQAKRSAVDGATGISRSLADGTGKAKANLNPFTRSVSTGLGPAKSAAWTGGLSVGDQLQAGVIQGFSGTQAQLSAQAAAAVRAAIAAARQAGDVHSPSRKTYYIGAMLGEGMVGGVRSRTGALATAGTHLIESLAKGIQTHDYKLTEVFDRVSGYADKWTNKLKGLQNTAKSFASGFQAFNTSVFSADLTDQTTGAGPTVADILGYARGQRSQAGQVRADVAKLQRAGLSEALLKQLQAAGPSGLAQIHTLASNASMAQIRQLNALDKATRSDLQKAGSGVASQLYGSQIAQARQNKDLADKIAAALHRLLVAHKGEDTNVYIQLDGRTIKETIREHDKKHGRKDKNS